MGIKSKSKNIERDENIIFTTIDFREKHSP